MNIDINDRKWTEYANLRLAASCLIFVCQAEALA